jgi:hypothetical protein
MLVVEFTRKMKFECMFAFHSISAPNRETPCKYTCVQDFDAAVTDLKFSLMKVIEEPPWGVGCGNIGSTWCAAVDACLK